MQVIVTKATGDLRIEIGAAETEGEGGGVLGDQSPEMKAQGLGEHIRSLACWSEVLEWEKRQGNC